MFYNLKHNLIIGGINIPDLVEASITSKRETAADELKIKLPRFTNLEKDDFKIGDEVDFLAGYKQTGLFPEFVGNITEITWGTPLTIVCKDPMHELTYHRLLKKNYFNKPLETLIQDCAGEYPFTIYGEQQKINVRCFNKSAAFALRYLRRYGLDAYFRGGRLIVKPWNEPEENREAWLFVFGENIKDQDSLVTRPEKDFKLTINTHDTGTGKAHSASYGSGPEEIEYINGLGSGVHKRVKELHKEKAAGGFSGEFKTFGYPPTWHSDVIEIHDPETSERSKTVIVDAVEKVYSMKSGFFEQRISPGKSVK